MIAHARRRFHPVLLAALLGPALACGLEEVGGDEDGGEALIPAPVQRAFDQSCATSAGCHATGSSLVVLSAPDSAAILETSSSSGGPFVTLGDVENSYLAQKILGGPGIVGGVMPPSPQSPNDDVNLAIIVGWIAGVPIEDEGGGDGDAPGDGDGDGDTLCFAEAPIPASPSFAADVWPTFEARCATAACHQVLAPLMPDADGAYANLIDMPAAAAMADYVTPGDPDASYLWHKLAATQSSVAGGGGSPMPIGGELCAAELQTIYAWILTGAGG